MDRELDVESGKLLIMPVKEVPKGPMTEFCLILPVQAGQFHVYSRTEPHPDKVKKLRTNAIGITRSTDVNTLVTWANSGYSKVGEIRAMSRLLLIGDLTFFYSGKDKRTNADYAKASRACRDSRTMGGNFETSTGEMATGIRLGDLTAKLEVIFKECESGLKLVIMKVYPTYADDDL
jgi:hypothetical protein